LRAPACSYTTSRARLRSAASAISSGAARTAARAGRVPDPNDRA
jgi:hypothetical protein